MISLQVFYEGHVQGIGLRFTVRHIAKGFDVTGWVRNLPDGRVELQVSGDHEEVRAFLDEVAQGERFSAGPHRAGQFQRIDPGTKPVEGKRPQKAPFSG